MTKWLLEGSGELIVLLSHECVQTTLSEAVYQCRPVCDKFITRFCRADLYQQLSRRKMAHKFWLARSGTKRRQENGLARSKVKNFNRKCKSYSKNSVKGRIVLFFSRSFKNYILVYTVTQPHIKGLTRKLSPFL